METNDLLEVFGGRDNLRLMCGATRFRKEARNRISFRVDGRLIMLIVTDRKLLYNLEIFDRVSGKMVCCAFSTEWDHIRGKFEYHTGYVLSF